MSTDRERGETQPGPLGHRMQSALTGATEWFAVTLSGDDGAGTGDAAAGRRPAVTDDGGAEGPGDPAGRTAREIVTPEERVVRLVTENGGSMKQGDVVSAVEWSESTVSRKLSKLESDGAITRYQIGREKLVFLPGHEPESLGSPWRDVADAPGRA